MSSQFASLSIAEIASIVGILAAFVGAAWTIYKWGRSQSRPARVGVVVGFLRPIDTDELSRSLNLEGKAAVNARREQPASNAQHLDSNEQDVIQRITSEWTWQGEAFVNEIGAYTDRLAQYSVHAEHSRLRLAAENAIARLKNANIRAPAELGPLKQAYIETRDEHSAFRDRHGLRRPARETPDRWTTFGLMVVLVAFESVLNGVFFAKGSEFGLIGGVGTAIGISVANVAFAFLLGIGPARWINYRNFLVRLVGVVLTVSGLAALLALHAFAAHFREATAQVGEERAFSVAVDSLFRAPWGLTDIASIYLFALGALFGVGAFWKGVTFDDPFPGYGAAHRRVVYSREHYSYNHALLFDELERIKEEVVEQLDKGIAQMPLFPQQAQGIKAQREALIERFRAYEATVGAAANQLLARYRAANQAERRTPKPAYFEELWRLPHSFLDGPNIPLPLEGSPAQSIGEILEELKQLSRAVLGEYERLIAAFPHPTEMS